MARIGKIPISIPDKVTVEMNNNEITVKGPKGELARVFDPSINIEIADGQITVTRNNDSRQQRAFHGLTRALLNNMVLGVSQGFKRELYIEGVGYRAQMDGKNLQLNLGYSHPIFFEASDTLTYEVDKTGRNLVVHGIDKEEVGEIAARIRRARPPEPYKGKGVRYKNEIIKRKAGKAGAKI